jgi:hypothetical protein
MDESGVALSVVDTLTPVPPIRECKVARKAWEQGWAGPPLQEAGHT